MTTLTRERPVFLTQAQAAAMLGVSRWTIRRLQAAGVLEPVRLAGLARPRYRRVDLEAYAEGGRAP